MTLASPTDIADSLSLHDRVWDLIGRIPDNVKANLMTARGHDAHQDSRTALPEIGVPSYYCEYSRFGR